MQEFIKIFLITLVSDIDNMLILGTILRRYNNLNITFPAIIVLTLTRATYITIVNGILKFPMIHLLIGLVLLFIAFKLVKRTYNAEDMRKSNRGLLLKLKVLGILAGTDFLICMDSVMIIAGISQHFKAVTLGIFCSLFISLLFLPLIVKLAGTFFLINIIAGAFIAQNAVLGILKDPILKDFIQYLENLIPEANLLTIATNGTIITFTIIGLISYIKHERITIHK